MKKLLKEFSDFTMKGNVINLAVGVIIGAAFQGIVSSLTDNLISPLIGIFVGKNFDHLTFTLFGATFGYGAFITSIINFIIMALVVFFIVKGMNHVLDKRKKDEPEAAPTTKTCPFCKSGVHLEATKCPSCTSELPIETPVEA